MTGHEQFNVWQGDDGWWHASCECGIHVGARRLRDQLAERMTEHIDYHARLELAHTKER